MAQLFDDVFNPHGIYVTFFFNVKAVLTYPSLQELADNNESLYERWKYLAKNRYVTDIDSKDIEYMRDIYKKNAVYYPEFTKIVAITYATAYNENGTIKRNMKKIVNDDEFIVLKTFMDELYRLSSEGVQSNPQQFSILCGHNIIGYDIPLLMKKFIEYRNKFDINKKIPLILKRSLNIKPWESGVIDTVNLWKFNGSDKTPLMLISDYLNLKKIVDLKPLDEISKTYWEIINSDNDIEKALEFVSLQSATQTNLVVQLINTLRTL